MSSHPIPPEPASPTTGAVRRHHTISAHSRAARASAKEVISEEIHDPQQGIWNDDEVVDQDWVGGVGAVGEKTSLHRQSSLPTRYHRGMPISAHPITLSFIHLLFQASKTRLQRRAISPQRPSTVSPPSQVTKATKNPGSSDHTMLRMMRSLFCILTFRLSA